MLPFVRQIAQGFIGRGEPLEDLIQVGCVGLVKAIDRFDPVHGVRLATFAAPTISGEIKRHFRDHGWLVRPPRDVQHLSLRVRREAAALAARLGRSPTVSDLARALGESEESVLDAIQASRGYAAVSADAPLDVDGEALVDRLGSEEPGFSRADDRAALLQGLEVLSPRERRIVLERFIGGKTQRQIAESLGISQMHVSRLLNRSLAALRVELRRAGEDPSRSADDE